VYFGLVTISLPAPKYPQITKILPRIDFNHSGIKSHIFNHYYHVSHFSYQQMVEYNGILVKKQTVDLVIVMF
jgi:hypothetical protein